MTYPSTVNDQFIRSAFESSPDGEQFTLLETLGVGGFGVVIKAIHKPFNRIVAIKFLHREVFTHANQLQRFRNEAHTLSALHHNNVLRIYTSGIAGKDTAYLVMEHLEGISLFELVNKQGPLSPQRFKLLFLRITEAIAFIHNAGVIHRDLKPQNIILCEPADESSDMIKLIDFGLATIDEYKNQKLTKTGLAVGSPAFMSPEQCRAKNIDARSDLYSLGCVMYFSACGSPVFPSENDYECMAMHIGKEPTVAKTDWDLESENWLRALLGNLLEKSPEDRFQTAEDVAAALRTDAPIKRLTKASKAHNTAQPLDKWKLPIAVLCALVISALAWLGYQTAKNLSSVGASRARLAAEGSPESLQMLLSIAEEYLNKGQTSEVIKTEKLIADSFSNLSTSSPDAFAILCKIKAHRLFNASKFKQSYRLAMAGLGKGYFKGPGFYDADYDSYYIINSLMQMNEAKAAATFCEKQLLSIGNPRSIKHFQSAAYLMHESRALLALGDNKEALKLAKRAVAEACNNQIKRDSLVNLYKVQWSLRRLTEALSTCKEIEEQDTDVENKALDQISEAAILSDEGRFAESTALIQSACKLEKSPKSKVLIKAAMVLFQRHMNLDLAENYYRSAIATSTAPEQRTELINACLGLAELLFLERRNQEALATIERIEHDNEDSETVAQWKHQNLAALFHRFNRDNRCLDECKKADAYGRTIDESSAPAAVRDARILEDNGETGKAQLACANAISTAMENGDSNSLQNAYLINARFLAHDGRVEQARENFEKAIESEKTYAPAQRTYAHSRILAFFLASVGLPSQATQQLESARAFLNSRIKQSDFQYYSNIVDEGDLLYVLGKESEARTLYEKALTLEREHYGGCPILFVTPLLYRLAIIDFNQANYKLALEEANEAIAQREAAKITYNDSMSSTDSYADLKIIRAGCLLHLGNADAAKAGLNESLNLLSSTAGIHKAMVKQRLETLAKSLKDRDIIGRASALKATDRSIYMSPLEPYIRETSSVP